MAHARVGAEVADEGEVDDARRAARCGRRPRTSACAGRRRACGMPARRAVPARPVDAGDAEVAARAAARSSRPWPPAMPVMRSFSPGLAPPRGWIHVSVAAATGGARRPERARRSGTSSPASSWGSRAIGSPVMPRTPPGLNHDCRVGGRRPTGRRASTSRSSRRSIAGDWAAGRPTGACRGARPRGGPGPGQPRRPRRGGRTASRPARPRAGCPAHRRRPRFRRCRPRRSTMRGTTSTPAVSIASAKRFITCWVTWNCGPP